MTRRARLVKLEPTGRLEPRWAIAGAPHYVVEGVLDEAEPTADGRWNRLPSIAVWVVRDVRLVSPLGLPLRGHVVRGEYLLRELRDWIDEHLDELVAGTAVHEPRPDRLGRPAAGQ